MQSIGPWLRTMRERKQLSATEVAARLGLPTTLRPVGAVVRVSAGCTSSPTTSGARRAFLGCDERS